MKKIAFCSFLLMFFLSFHGWALPSPDISITGVVKQLLHLTLHDLSKLEQTSVTLNEVTRDKDYHGSFLYRGVPLRTLLELASIQKEKTDFFKPVDLVIIIKNKEGKQTVLSWGEIFYRNPSEIIIALTASPVMSHKSCKDCHNPETYEPWLNQLKRQVGFPKLVVANDFYTDRCLEDITNIEVVDLHPKLPLKKLPELFSPKFTITAATKMSKEFSDLASYSHIQVLAKQMGEGRGYHGLKDFTGVPLLELIKEADLDPDLNTVFLISAPDGYRSSVSYGELTLNPDGRNIVIADKAAGQPLKENGKFSVIFPNDLSADRWVKAVSKIEAIQLKQPAKLYIIGIGCADTSLISLEAISYMGKSNVFVSTENIAKRFAK